MTGKSDDNNPLLTKQLLLRQVISELGTEELRIRAKMGSQVASKVLTEMPPFPDVTHLPPSFVVQEARLQLIGAVKNCSGLGVKLFAAVCARSMLKQLLDVSSLTPPTPTSQQPADPANLASCPNLVQPTNVQGGEDMSEASDWSIANLTLSTECPTQTRLGSELHTEATGSIVEPMHVHPTIVLLAFTKHSKHFHAAVSKTPVAQRFRQEQVNVRPPWANGAKIFVDGLLPGDAGEFRAVFAQQPRLGPNHVVLHEQDEPEFLEAFGRHMKRLHPRNRVTVKPQGGRLVLTNYSLDAQRSAMAGPSAAGAHASGETGNGLPLIDIHSLPEDDFDNLLQMFDDVSTGSGLSVPAPMCSSVNAISEVTVANLNFGSLPSYAVKVDNFQRLVPIEEDDNESSGFSGAIASAPF
mmetsp:Transcript_182/g.350  ORF Transcript_182/g.350 Transcript_182/m.350 type:complete len:411 (-) Transcript_182:404-1636(-)